jgi:hypothetical protein
VNVDKMYLNYPKKFKDDLDINFEDLIISFDRYEDIEKFMKSEKLFKDKNKNNSKQTKKKLPSGHQGC